jgi:NAD(P)-dependent dehydrogenase (short-subunit alcohol dehydrogenase family)
MGRLTGKVALVTGASRGLGRAVALAYAREGAALAICARGEEALLRVAEEIRALGGRVLAVKGDASDRHDVERIVSLTLQAYGRIDVLVNNASIFGLSPAPYLLDYPVDDFVEVLRVNTVGPFLVTRQVLGAMLQRGEGAIINVSSSAGVEGYAGWGAYSVSKFALEGLSRVWAEEVAGTGVRVNLVDPGEMDTEMHAAAVPDCDYALARPEDVTPVFVYLASDEARDVNGQRFLAQEFATEAGE